MKLRTEALVISCLLLIVSVPLAVATGKADAASSSVQPVVLKAVSFGPLTHNNAVPMQKFIDRINAQSKGKLQIKYLGATDVAALYDQPEALRTGVFDILITFPAAYVNLLPIAAGMNLGDLNPPEWHKSGAHDFLVEAHRAINMRYLGSFAAFEDGSYLYLKDKIAKPEQLAGLKFAAGPTDLLSIVAWGGSGVRVAMGEKYSALERRMVDGVAGVLASHYSDSLFEVTKYWLPYSLCSAMTSMVMNLKSWDGLPKDTQSLVAKTVADLEAEAVSILRAAAEDTQKKLIAKGMEKLSFSPEDATRFQQVALAAKWADIEKTVGSATVAKFKKMLNK